MRSVLILLLALCTVNGVVADPPCSCSCPAMATYPGVYRPNPRAVWDYYEVSRDGHFRPRVVAAPQPYFRVDYRPYYYLPISGQDVKAVTR